MDYITAKYNTIAAVEIIFGIIYIFIMNLIPYLYFPGQNTDQSSA